LAYKTGQAKNSISPELRPGSMTFEDRYLVPRYDGEASSPAFNMEVNPMDLVLLQYFGLKTLTDAGTGTDYTYPFASSMNYDVAGVELEGLNLNWQQLYDDYLSEMMDYSFNGIKAKVNLKVDFKIFLYLLKLTLPRASNADNYRFVLLNNVKYLPEVLTINFAGNAIKECELTMRRRYDE
jgi:hypothetical protein